MSALEPDGPSPPSDSTGATGSDRNPRLNALLDAIAEGRPIDWAEVRRNSGLPEAVIRQYEVLAGVAVMNGEGDGTGSDSSQSIGHVLAAASTHATDDTAASGTPWGPLRRLERVGSGAFGDVYRAYYPELETFVALKILRVSRMAGTARHRAAADARLLARLRHPNIVTVHGAAEIDGELGVWMDFIQGRTLDQIVQSNGQLSAKEALVVGESLCDALAAAHKESVLHRDIKAENVMREIGGKYVLLDFGIGGEIVSTTGHGVGAAGTPLYMAPELFTGAPASIQSDIYSLGVLLFYLVTGTFPVAGRTYDEVREKHAVGRRVLLADVRPGLPRQFLRIVERATAHNPADRYPSAGAMLADFDEPTLPPPGLWIRWDTAATVGLLLFSAGPYLLGQVTTVAYNVALDRVEPFARDSLVDTWVIGRRLLFPLPALYVLVTVLIWRIGGAVCSRAATWPLLANRRVVQRLVGLCTRVANGLRSAQPRSLSDALVLAQVAVVILLCWLFWDVLSASLAKLTDTDPALLAPLRPKAGVKHLYMYSLCVAGLAMVTVWVRLLSRHGVRQVGLANTAVGLTLIALVLVLVALPYRLIFMNVSQRADYQGMRCYITGAVPHDHPQQYLLYCPDAPAPKVRPVFAGPAVVVRDEYENILTPMPALTPPFVLTP